MPEVVKPYLRQTGTLQEPGEVTVSEVRGVDDPANLVGEHQPTRAVEGSHLFHLCKLSGKVRAQRLDRAGREAHATSAVGSLRRSYVHLAAGARDSTPDAQDGFLDLHVLPLEGQ